MTLPLEAIGAGRGGCGVSGACRSGAENICSLSDTILPSNADRRGPHSRAHHLVTRSGASAQGGGRACTTPRHEY